MSRPVVVRNDIVTLHGVEKVDNESGNWVGRGGFS